MKEKFINEALDAGFTEEQADFMWYRLSEASHSHPQYVQKQEAD